MKYERALNAVAAFSFSMRHFGPLSHNRIKTRRNGIHESMFSDNVAEFDVIFFGPEA